MRNMIRPRPTLRDAVLLIGAAAVGLGAYQWAHRSLFPGWVWLVDRGLPSRVEFTPEVALIVCSDVASLLIATGAPWTLVLLFLRLKSPRPARWRRLWRQPGMSASLAVILAWCWTGAALLLALGMEFGNPGRVSRPADARARHYLAGEIFQYLGVAVAVTWLVQALSGHWQRPADWIDRMGRVVGVLWICIGFVWTMRAYMMDLA